MELASASFPLFTVGFQAWVFGGPVPGEQAQLEDARLPWLRGEGSQRTRVFLVGGPESVWRGG